MKQIISRKLAVNGLLIALSLLVAFHILILAGVIPFKIVWGDRLKDKSQMLVFETASAIINLIMLAIVGIYAGILKVKINSLVIKIMLCIMVGLSTLNTIGNLLSNNNFEKMVFTPVTVILLIFSLRLALSDSARPLP